MKERNKAKFKFYYIKIIYMYMLKKQMVLQVLKEKSNCLSTPLPPKSTLL